MNTDYLLIPGNPAVESYYTSWIDEIKKRNKDMNIRYATSHVMFSRKLNYLEYENAMFAHYEKILAESPAEKTTLIAHSAGSYFALRLLEKYPEKISKVIIIFPYIGYSTIKSLNFVEVPYVIDRLFPLAETIAFCKNIIGTWDEHARNISKKELAANLRFGVRQCAYFNRYKFDTNKVLKYKDRIHFIYTEPDKWCPPVAVNLLKQVSDFKEVQIPHDFISSIENRSKMTEVVLPFLAN